MSGLIRDTRNQPGLEVVPPVRPQDTKYYSPKSTDAPPYGNELPTTASPGICGLSTRTFWLAFVLVLLVLGAAIGGGVGGGLSAEHKNKNVPTAVQQQSTSSSSPSSAASPTPSSTFSTSTSSSISTSTSTSTGIEPFSTQPGTYRIINIATNTAIDLYNGGTTNGTEIECWRWNPYDKPSSYVHQSWQIASVGNGAIIILNTQTNSYITAPNNLTAGTNPNNAVDASVYGGVPGSPADSHTQWVIVKNSDDSISFQSKAYTSKYLDLTASNPTDGTPVVLWESNDGLNQEWKLVPS